MTNGVGETFRVDSSYMCHGVNRDVYEGECRHFGKIAIKVHPMAGVASNAQELQLLEKGFDRFAVHLWWSGEVTHGGQQYSVIVEKMEQSLFSAFKDLLASPPSPSVLRGLIDYFNATVQLFLDLKDYPFTIMDAGPHNLAYCQSSKRVVFLDYEHITEGRPSRQKLNQAFARMLSSAASFMALTAAWNTISTSIYDMARAEWWLLLDDSTIYGVDREWVHEGLVALFSRLKEMIPKEVATKAAAANAAAEVATKAAAANAAAGAKSEIKGTAVGSFRHGIPQNPNTSPVVAKGLTRGSRQECLGTSAASSVDVAVAEVVDVEVVAAEDVDVEVVAVEDVGPYNVLLEIWKIYEIYEPASLDFWEFLVKEHAGGLEPWLAELRSRHVNREFACYGDPEWRTATDAVSSHVQTNRNQRFRGTRVDGSSGPNAELARIDWDTRVLEGTWTHRPCAARDSGDSIAALLTAWHTTVAPLCIDRCELNSKTGEHLRSITDMKRFIPNNMRYVAKLFGSMVGPEDEWFELNNVKIVVEEMFGEACKREHGRWQWRGFWIDNTEHAGLVYGVLQAYILGSEHADEIPEQSLEIRAFCNTGFFVPGPHALV
jgi:hypothetical protein